MEDTENKPVLHKQAAFAGQGADPGTKMDKVDTENAQKSYPLP